MAEFTYNNVKNANTGYTLFKLNCEYHPRNLYKKNISFYSKLKTGQKILAKVTKLVINCQKNLYYIKNSKVKLTIKALSLRAMLLIKKFDSIANILRPNINKSWK